MLRFTATEAFISKGYDNAPALRFSEKGDAVRFRIGMKVYDTRAENNTRWVNLAVKAFGTVCGRVKKMQLKEGSRVNLAGRYDEDVWEDPNTHEKKSAPVIILDELEYCFTGTGEKKSGDGQRAAAGSQTFTGSQNGAGSSASGFQNSAGSSAAVSQGASDDMPAGFEGFSAFGGSSFFFNE